MSDLFNPINALEEVAPLPPPPPPWSQRPGYENLGNQDVELDVSARLSGLDPLPRNSTMECKERASPTIDAVAPKIVAIHASLGKGKPVAVAQKERHGRTTHVGGRTSCTVPRKMLASGTCDRVRKKCGVTGDQVIGCLIAREQSSNPHIKLLRFIEAVTSSILR